MIKSALYREPKLLDSQLHRGKKLQPLTDYSITKEMHAVFLTATEFPSAALVFPIIFVHTGERTPEGRAMIAPVALLGLANNENLWLDGTKWEARYIPAFIRRFPFLTAGVEGSEAPAVFVDTAWSGFGDTDGEALFDAEGKPMEVLTRIIGFLQQFDAEQQRTRQVCLRVLELDVLKEIAADITLPHGETLKVEGFLTVDEEKLNALSDADVVELHRSGVLMLLQVHLVSLGNMRQLAERKAIRMAAEAAQTAVA